jgi:hypothetical protein
VRLSTSFDNPQDTRFRLRTTHWKISDKDLTDADPSNANTLLDKIKGPAIKIKIT